MMRWTLHHLMAVWVTVCVLTLTVIGAVHGW